MALKIVRFAGLLLSGIVAGVYVHGAIGGPSTQRLSGAALTEGFQESNGDFARIMTPIGVSSLTLDLLALILLRRPRSRPFLWTAAALALNMGAVATTMRVNVPVNEEVMGWNAQDLPDHWETARDRWVRGSKLRTVLGVLGLGCLIVAAQSS